LYNEDFEQGRHRSSKSSRFPRAATDANQLDQVVDGKGKAEKQADAAEDVGPPALVIDPLIEEVDFVEEGFVVTVGNFNRAVQDLGIVVGNFDIIVGDFDIVLGGVNSAAEYFFECFGIVVGNVGVFIDDVSEVDEDVGEVEEELVRW